MNNNVHILLIEDDKKISNFMAMALKAKGYKISIASTGNAGILSFCTQNPQIILLDLGLPDKEGLDLIKEIRLSSDIPILVVSAREQEKDKINALDAGANDYVTKPFSMGELMARIRVLERFIANENELNNKTITIKDLTIDIERRYITIANTELHLTPIEYKLLLYLVSNRGKVVTHSQISKEVWGYGEYCDSKSIRVFMANLRRKIEANPAKPQYILTEAGVGYRFADS